MRDARVGQGARSRPSTPDLDGVLEWLQAWLLALRAPGPRAIDARRGAVLSRTRAAAGSESARRLAAGESSAWSSGESSAAHGVRILCLLAA